MLGIRLPMPSLSFMKPKTTRWKAIVSNRSPFPPSRGDNLNIASPHPYASPDILNINDGISSQRSTPEPPPKSPAPRHLAPPGSRPLPATSSTLPAPPVQIDVDISSEPFDSDWFQTHVTESPSSPWFKDKGKVCNRVAVGKTRAVEVARASPLAINRPPIVVDEDDDVEMSSSEDDVLGDLKAMDVGVHMLPAVHESYCKAALDDSRHFTPIKQGKDLFVIEMQATEQGYPRWFHSHLRR